MFASAHVSVLLAMNTEALTPRKLKRLARIDRRLSAGRLRFAVSGAGAGFVGGLCWVALMALMAPGFGRSLGAPTGSDTHPQLAQVFYWLATHVGPLPAIGLIAGTLFGAAFALFSYGAAWRLLVNNHAALASRAIAAGQFTPRYASPLLRWYPTRS